MPPGMYRSLAAHLAALPPEQEAVTLSFAALEALCGPLSWTARVSQSHWAVMVQRRTWQPTGWSARLHYGAESVTFTRGQPDTPA